MNFGKVADPSAVDFTLPPDDAATLRILKKAAAKKMAVYVGCAKWNKTDLKNFYPKGTKDELAYYSRQFNSIELNAIFYNMPKVEQVISWSGKTPAGFKFFPKITNSISHYSRLVDVKEKTEQYCNAIANFEKKLGMVFLQLHDKFSPKEMPKLEKFIKEFPKGIPLAIELRNAEWFADADVFKAYTALLEKYKVTNIIVDTAGRRDMLHMRLTTPAAFVRWVGCNDDVLDHKRLDDWVERIAVWQKEGLKELDFFIHQNMEVSSPLLAGYFIEKLNARLGLSLKAPQRTDEVKKALF